MGILLQKSANLSCGHLQSLLDSLVRRDANDARIVAANSRSRAIWTNPGQEADGLRPVAQNARVERDTKDERKRWIGGCRRRRLLVGCGCLSGEERRDRRTRCPWVEGADCNDP